MDFLRPVLSILPSIVGIIGDLFGANDYDYLKFSLRLPNSNSSDDDNIYFIKEGDDIIICNSTKDTIQVSFPAENGTKAVSYAVKTAINGLLRVLSFHMPRQMWIGLKLLVEVIYDQYQKMLLVVLLSYLYQGK